MSCQEITNQESEQTEPLTGTPITCTEIESNTEHAFWETGQTLRIRFLDGPSYNPIKTKIIEYAKEWTKHCRVKFDFVEGGPSDIRISLNRDQSVWSMIGKDALLAHSDSATMNIVWVPDEFLRAIVLHTFGHALGLVHEHGNPDFGIPWDKEATYDHFISANHEWNESKVDRCIFNKYSDDLTPVSYTHLTLPTKRIV